MPASEQAGRSMGQSTRGKSPTLPPPAMTSTRSAPPGGSSRVGGASTSSGATRKSSRADAAPLGPWEDRAAHTDALVERRGA